MIKIKNALSDKKTQTITIRMNGQNMWELARIIWILERIDNEKYTISEVIRMLIEQGCISAEELLKEYNNSKNKSLTNK